MGRTLKPWKGDMKSTILVASDGTPGAVGALRMAAALQERDGSRVEVIGVVEPIPAFDVGMMVTIPESGLAEARIEGLEREIREQIGGITGDAQGWPLEVDAGIPGPRIVRKAKEVGASLILLGLGRHRAVDRLLGGETALQVVRLASCSVLAVPGAGGIIPRTALVAIDFSLHCQRAAEAAARLIDPPGTLILAHVMQGLRFLRDVPEDWESRYRSEVEVRLDELRRALHLPGGIEVRTRILEGDPARELLDLAGEEGVDLLGAGTHGHAFVTRILLGSVSTRLLRGAAVATLVTPAEAEAPETRAPASEHPWAALLDRFTRDHAGRSVTIEFIDPELGAQVSGKGSPLRGLDFDVRSSTLHIMLGPLGGTEGHVTHSIRSPTSLDLASGGGRHEVIRVGLARGELLLRVHDS